MDRRKFLCAAAGGLATTCMSLERRVDARLAPCRSIGLGFSLYGMKSLTIAEGLAACKEIGYDCVELPVMPDWPADSRKISAAEKTSIRETLQRHDLRLSAIMENLPILADPLKHQDNLERLKLAAELAHTLPPDRPTLVETVLGGAPNKWEELKDQIRDRLGEWEKAAAAAKTVLAIKAHVNNAMRTPEQLIWMLEQINSPWLRAAYDYSHFALQKIDMAESVKKLMPYTVFVHVKDEQGEQGKFRFLLPGEGTTDYKKLVGLFREHGYVGDVVVEVSGQVFSQAGYEPLPAAKKCFEALKPAF